MTVVDRAVSYAQVATGGTVLLLGPAQTGGG